MKNKKKTIIKWTSIVLAVLVLLTVVMTFFGINLPWTAFRASAIKHPESYNELEWDEQFEWNEQYVKERYWSGDMEGHMWKLVSLSEKFGFTLYTTSYGEDDYIEVSIDDNDLLIARAVLSFYAKWNNVLVFYSVFDYDEGGLVLP